MTLTQKATDLGREELERVRATTETAAKGTGSKTGDTGDDGQTGAEAMLSAGIMPSAEQLSAMGMTESQAQAYITAAQLEAASKGSGSKKGSGGDDEKKLTGAEAVYQKLQDAGYNYRSNASQMTAYLAGLGVTNAATYVAGFVSWDRDNSAHESVERSPGYYVLKGRLDTNISDAAKIDEIEHAKNNLKSITEEEANELLSYIGY